MASTSELLQMCRTCLSKHFHNLMRMNSEVFPEFPTSVFDMFLQCYPNVAVHRNHFICMSCVNMVHDIFKFNEQLKKATELFDQMIANANIEPHDVKPIKPELLDEHERVDHLPPTQLVVKPEPVSSRIDSPADISSEFNINLVKKEIIDEEEALVPDVSTTIQSENSSENPPKTKKLKRYTCKHCNKEVTHSSTLRRHERLHAGIKPFCCSICKKGFAVLSNLKVHERVHSGEKPYVCGVCQTTFSQVGNLRAHELTHSGERPYSCNVCKKDFAQLSTLKQHERLHSGEKPFSCSICQRQFTVLSSLKSHERVHSGEKPHICKVCKKQFGHSSHLKSHERIHSGIKPHRCEICNRGFTQSSNLRRHLVTHDPSNKRAQKQKHHLKLIKKEEFGEVILPH